MSDRRTLLAAGTTALMAAPYLARASANSQTPVVDGKRVRRRLSSLPADDPFFEAYSQREGELAENDRGHGNRAIWVRSICLEERCCQSVVR